MPPAPQAGQHTRHLSGVAHAAKPCYDLQLEHDLQNGHDMQHETLATQSINDNNRKGCNCGCSILQSSSCLVVRSQHAEE